MGRMKFVPRPGHPFGQSGVRHVHQYADRRGFVVRLRNPRSRRADYFGTFATLSAALIVSRAAATALGRPALSQKEMTK